MPSVHSVYITKRKNQLYNGMCVPVLEAAGAAKRTPAVPKLYQQANKRALTNSKNTVKTNMLQFLCEAAVRHGKIRGAVVINVGFVHA